MVFGSWGTILHCVASPSLACNQVLEQTNFLAYDNFHHLLFCIKHHCGILKHKVRVLFSCLSILANGYWRTCRIPETYNLKQTHCQWIIFSEHDWNFINSMDNGWKQPFPRVLGPNSNFRGCRYPSSGYGFLFECQLVCKQTLCIYRQNKLPFVFVALAFVGFLERLISQWK